MVMIPQGNQAQQKELKSLFQVMKEVEEILDKGHMTETEKVDSIHR